MFDVMFVALGIGVLLGLNLGRGKEGALGPHNIPQNNSVYPTHETPIYTIKSEAGVTSSMKIESAASSSYSDKKDPNASTAERTQKIIPNPELIINASTLAAQLSNEKSGRPRENSSDSQSSLLPSQIGNYTSAIESVTAYKQELISTTEVSKTI